MIYNVTFREECRLLQGAMEKCKHKKLRIITQKQDSCIEQCEKCQAVFRRHDTISSKKINVGAKTRRVRG